MRGVNDGVRGVNDGVRGVNDGVPSASDGVPDASYETLVKVTRASGLATVCLG